MTLTEALEVLRKHNEWRRDKVVTANPTPIDPVKIGIAIEVVCEVVPEIVSATSAMVNQDLRFVSNKIDGGITRKQVTDVRTALTKAGVSP